MLRNSHAQLQEDQKYEIVVSSLLLSFSTGKTSSSKNTLETANVIAVLL